METVLLPGKRIKTSCCFFEMIQEKFPSKHYRCALFRDVFYNRPMTPTLDDEEVTVE